MKLIKKTLYILGIICSLFSAVITVSAEQQVGVMLSITSADGNQTFAHYAMISNGEYGKPYFSTGGGSTGFGYVNTDTTNAKNGNGGYVYINGSNPVVVWGDDKWNYPGSCANYSYGGIASCLTEDVVYEMVSRLISETPNKQSVYGETAGNHTGWNGQDLKSKCKSSGLCGKLASYTMKIEPLYVEDTGNKDSLGRTKVKYYTSNSSPISISLSDYFNAGTTGFQYSGAPGIKVSLVKTADGSNTVEKSYSIFADWVFSSPFFNASTASSTQVVIKPERDSGIRNKDTSGIFGGIAGQPSANDGYSTGITYNPNFNVGSSEANTLFPGIAFLDGDPNDFSSANKSRFSKTKMNNYILNGKKAADGFYALLYNLLADADNKIELNGEGFAGYNFKDLKDALVSKGASTFGKSGQQKAIADYSMVIEPIYTWTDLTKGKNRNTIYATGKASESFIATNTVGGVPEGYIKPEESYNVYPLKDYINPYKNSAQKVRIPNPECKGKKSYEIWYLFDDIIDVDNLKAGSNWYKTDVSNTGLLDFKSEEFLAMLRQDAGLDADEEVNIIPYFKDGLGDIRPIKKSDNFIAFYKEISNTIDEATAGGSNKYWRLTSDKWATIMPGNPLQNIYVTTPNIRYKIGSTTESAPRTYTYSNEITNTCSNIFSGETNKKAYLWNLAFYTVNSEDSPEGGLGVSVNTEGSGNDFKITAVNRYLKKWNTTSTNINDHPFLAFQSLTRWARNINLSELDSGYPSGTIVDTNSCRLYNREQLTNSDVNHTYLLVPVHYVVDFCIGEEEEPPNTCTDTVEQAKCEDNDYDGVHAKYYENDDIKKCAANKNENSGFRMLETDYGNVSCKENLDYYLPTNKDVTSGGYFTLNVTGNELPSIEAKRICATSQVDYNKFDTDLKNLETQMPEPYETYKGAYDVLGRVKITKNTSSSESCTYDCNCSTSTYTVTNADGTTSTRTSTTCDTCTANYTEYDWEIAGVDAYNGQYSYGGDSGIYRTGNYSPCGLSQGISASSALASVKSAITEDARTNKQTYENLQKQYSKAINEYTSIFSWSISGLNKTKVNSSSSLGTASTMSLPSADADLDKYKYTFMPEVLFNYQDEDGRVFSVPYKYPQKSLTPNTKLSYWSQGSTANNTYTDANSGTQVVQRTITDCGVGNTDYCKKDNKTMRFYKNSSVRRDETIKHEYTLPDVKTTIPDGKVYAASQSTGNKTAITLEKNAVPVNINTEAGTKLYSITISKYKDQIRSSVYNSFGNNKKDDWADDKNGNNVNIDSSRLVKNNVFNGSEYSLTNNSYVCKYNVTNDIYLPKEKKFGFFYRVVDTYNINPLGRDLGYNWTTSAATEVKTNGKDNIKSDALDVTHLTENHDRFVYTLNPVDMQQIRTYNKGTNYADWDLRCADYSDGGYQCQSNFLNCLVGGSALPGQKSCTEIIGNNRTNYEFDGKTVYNDSSLTANRNLLKNKQLEVDKKDGINTSGG